ncbi:hypothetical protein P9314_11575 [Paenibacillus validus]|uniref:DUF6953 family protein n=1 Tax=Paenibacillus TaxID=44249 RepID=UPI0013E0BA14|nr:MULTISPECIES: hypothetical protein [Paenibacillus]MED4601343.1 hypothetical protein [Paenibacillus validus]MED4608142.1 hypothetical protein [Paenibacillus validus]
MEYSAQDVADWMLAKVKNAGILYQSDAVNHIVSHFGESYIYVNENGNTSISKEVKKLFKKLHGGRVAWDRDGFFWGWT